MVSYVDDLIGESAVMRGSLIKNLVWKLLFLTTIFIKLKVFYDVKVNFLLDLNLSVLSFTLNTDFPPPSDILVGVLG